MKPWWRPKNGANSPRNAADRRPPNGTQPCGWGRQQLAGSLIGGIRETQEMLNFCAAQNVASDVEVIPIQQLDQAYKRLLRGDVRYRFVVDIAILKGG